MRIPVFISTPTLLNSTQTAAKQVVLDELESLRLEPRSLGSSDYPSDLPLREVYVLGTHCSGGVILGFEQFYAPVGMRKRGTPRETSVTGGISYPTPWNQLEAGILFSLGLPLLVFREVGIDGGIFDPGVTDVFVHQMPEPDMTPVNREAVREVFLKWQARVREHYYKDRRPTSGSTVS
ncbi:MAG: hypothetical protein MUO31_00245 [Thermodesulfovibrionales bacterium]|nr:hypothetical protein [Thermodesulfovibrionales bacterium]